MQSLTVNLTLCKSRPVVHEEQRFTGMESENSILAYTSFVKAIITGKGTFYFIIRNDLQKLRTKVKQMRLAAISLAASARLPSKTLLIIRHHTITVIASQNFFLRQFIINHNSNALLHFLHSTQREKANKKTNEFNWQQSEPRELTNEGRIQKVFCIFVPNKLSTGKSEIKILKKWD